MTKAQKVEQATEQAQAIERLRSELKPRDKVYTKVEHVSASGMSRSIRLYLIQDNQPWDISGMVARFDQRNGGVVIGGCGMDMGFALVYDLSSALFRDGFDCIGEDARCPSNDHLNDRGERNYSPNRHHNSGGYALHHSWF